MSLYRRALKYTKPLTEIDEKIARLEEEMMTTSNMYVTGQHVDAQPPVEPTVGEIPDGSLGDFSDLNSFTQNADTDNVDQLTVNDDAGTLTPITQIMETSNLGLGEGITAVAMGRHGRAATGMVYGFIDSRNVFNEVFVIGGLRPSGYGESDIIDDGLDWYFAYVNGKSIEAVGWKCYNVQSLYDALYTPLATNVGPGGTYNLHSNSLLFVKNQNFLIDAGSPNRPASFTLLSRNGLGDSTYYPGPIQQLINLAKGAVSLGQNITDFISGMTGSGAVSGGIVGPMPNVTTQTPPPETPTPTPTPTPTQTSTSTPTPTPTPTETEDDGKLVPTGYDENGNPTGFVRLSESQMEQFKDGGGTASIREGKTFEQVLQQGHENRKNAVTNFTSGISDGMTVLSQVQDTLQYNRALGNIKPSSDGGRSTIKEGERGSSTNPVQTNLSDISMNTLQNAVNNFDPKIDGSPNKTLEENLRDYLNNFTSTSDNLGLKSTHNNIIEVEIRGDDIVIKDRYGFGPSEDIKSSPIPFTRNPITGKSNTVGQVADTVEVVVNALGGDGKDASEQVQTIFDQLGPVGEVAGRIASGGQSGLPGKNDPIVHFETVISGAAKNLGSNAQEPSLMQKGLEKKMDDAGPMAPMPQPKQPTGGNMPLVPSDYDPDDATRIDANYNYPIKGETLFEKWKKKDQKKSKPSQLQLIYNYFYYLPKAVKKIILMDMKVEVQIMMLPPKDRSFREKELRNTLINKHHEIYMDANFSENKEQTSRVKKILARNIKLTDPKTFKDVKVPSFKKLLSVDYVNEVGAPKKKPKLKNRNKKTAARFVKKPRKKTAMELIDEKIIQLEKDIKKLDKQ